MNEGNNRFHIFKRSIPLDHNEFKIPSRPVIYLITLSSRFLNNTFTDQSGKQRDPISQFGGLTPFSICMSYLNTTEASISLIVLEAKNLPGQAISDRFRDFYTTHVFHDQM